MLRHSSHRAPARSDAQLEAFASQHTPELTRALQELGANDEHAYKIHNEVYKTVCKVLKPAEGQERPSGAALEEIRRGIVDKLNAIEQMQGRSAHLGRQVYQVVEAQIKQIDQAIVREEASMAEVRERILALTPEGMAPEALLLADAARNGGAGSSGAGSRAGRRSKAKGASLPAAPAPLAGAELLAPMAQAVPPHHVPYKFNLPGREPFVEFIDPGEPMYCTCQQPSQGSMIGCDNPSCKYEWFHYACVGITQEPERWICPECTAAGYR